MSDYVLSCCSTADMNEAFFKERKIIYALFHFEMNGKEYDDDLGKTIPYDTFYKMIKDGATPTTSQVNAEEFIALWEPYLKEGKDILHLTLSSGISGVINSAMIAKSELNDKYPNQKVEVVDSLGASSGFGLLMTHLADLKDQGKSLEEVKAWAEENKLMINHWFFSLDLTSYLRGGRISRPEHFLGSLLGLCPLLNMDNEGRLIPREKVRTKKKVIKAIVNKMVENAEHGTDYDGYCYISESACYDDANMVKTLIEETFPKLKGKVVINSIGTVIGSHTGPGTVALFFKGKKRID